MLLLSLPGKTILDAMVHKEIRFPRISHPRVDFKKGSGKSSETYFCNKLLNHRGRREEPRTQRKQSHLEFSFSGFHFFGEAKIKLNR
jgi:hypothetical protein